MILDWSIAHMVAPASAPISGGHEASEPGLKKTLRNPEFVFRFGGSRRRRRAAR
jgi:hypothetical protein